MAHIHIHMTSFGPTSETIDIEGSDSHFHEVPHLFESTGAAPLGEAHVHTYYDGQVTGPPVTIEEVALVALAANEIVDFIEEIIGTPDE